MFKDQQFERQYHNANTLQSALLLAQPSSADAQRYLTLLAIGNGQFDFEDANLNGMVNVTTQPFEAWLRSAWAAFL